MTEIAFACACGQVAGRLDADPSDGLHLTCHCGDCRALMRISGQRDPGTDGVAIFQTSPDRIAIDRGAGLLEGLTLKRKGGLIRWRAACCGTPLFGTPRGRGMPFAGVLVGPLADPAPLGQVRMRGFLPGPKGRPRHEHLGRLIVRMIRRSAAARLSGRWRRTPFFDASGAPAGPVRGLTPGERARGYPS